MGERGAKSAVGKYSGLVLVERSKSSLDLVKRGCYSIKVSVQV